jgi:hypothetical protein
MKTWISEILHFTPKRFSDITTTCILLFTGMDAQVSYAFHSERKLHPEKFKNQLINQVLQCLLYS